LHGRLSDSGHIELNEPVAGMEGEVDVLLRTVVVPARPGTVDVFELIAATAPSIRSKEDIDRQVAEEHGSRGDR